MLRLSLWLFCLSIATSVYAQGTTGAGVGPASRPYNGGPVSSPYKASNGTCALPSYTYTSDPDLGSYRIGANNEGFCAGGVAAFDYNATRVNFSLPITAGAITVSSCTGCGSGTSPWGVNGSDIYFNTGKVGLGTVTPLYEFSSQISTAGSPNRLMSLHPDNTNAASSALIGTRVGGASSGDSMFSAGIVGVGAWSWGLDNSDSDKWKLNWDDTASVPAILQGLNVMNVDAFGNVTFPVAVITPSIQGVGATKLTLSDNANALFTNAAGTNFGLIKLGGTTSSFSALKRSGATLESRLADDSGYAEFRASIFATQTALITATGGSTPSFLVNGVGGVGGPTTAAQNGWMKMLDSTGATVWVAVWK